MRTKDIYQNLFRMALVIIPVLLLACERIKDNMDDCGIYLEFLYDYNMEYTDAFATHISTVDVFVFDANETYLFSKHARREELIDGNSMFLGNDLDFGQYKLLTIGGLTDYFRISENGNDALVAGQTQLKDVQIALKRQSRNVSHEFSPLWVSKSIDINYQADLSVYPISFIKNTNRFHLSLVRQNENKENIQTKTIPHTFEVRTSEGAVYNHRNLPQLKEIISYTPYIRTTKPEDDAIVTEKINTMRLIESEEHVYNLVIHNSKTGKILWNYNLMALLEHTKPDYSPHHTTLPMQEYLDRQSEWNLTVLYTDTGMEGGFVALAVIINDWIVWLNEIEI